MLDYRQVFDRAVERVQDKAEKDRCWAIDMVAVVKDAIAALTEVDAFDRDNHGDSLTLDPEGWSRCVTIKLRELLSFNDMAPLLFVLGRMGYHESDDGPRDHVKQGMRCWTLWNDRYQSIELDAYLDTAQVPECHVITVTKVTHVDEFVCEER